MTAKKTNNLSTVMNQIVKIVRNTESKGFEAINKGNIEKMILNRDLNKCTTEKFEEIILFL